MKNNNNTNFAINFTKNIALTAALAVNIQGCSQYGAIYQSDATRTGEKENSYIKIVNQLTEGLSPHIVEPRVVPRLPVVQHRGVAPTAVGLLQRQQGVAPWLTPQAAANAEAFDRLLFEQSNPV